jgi:hypothetical protein
MTRVLWINGLPWTERGLLIEWAEQLTYARRAA